MVKDKKQIIISFLIFVAITYTLFISSVFVHESVHWVQATIDNRTDPNKMVFFFERFSPFYVGENETFFESLFETRTLAYVSHKFKENVTLEEKQAFVSEHPLREFEAYSIQYVYLAIMLFLTFYMINTRPEKNKDEGLHALKRCGWF